MLSGQLIVSVHRHEKMVFGRITSKENIKQAEVKYHISQERQQTVNATYQ